MAQARATPQKRGVELNLTMDDVDNWVRKEQSYASSPSRSAKPKKGSAKRRVKPKQRKQTRKKGRGPVRAKKTQKRRR